eukprot:TRINITY_DN1805_c0_g1_i2.p1 TRINITY_DN1805_c0_g1~~TRINITY_DN1805_c0_g1_i2.p1  ORF type:complete len:571 (+),score=158.81 TRINITY_DN1805_c0_g1_i2:38-1750(+)
MNATASHINSNSSGSNSSNPSSATSQPPSSAFALDSNALETENCSTSCNRLRGLLRELLQPNRRQSVSSIPSARGANNTMSQQQLQQQLLQQQDSPKTIGNFSATSEAATKVSLQFSSSGVSFKSIPTLQEHALAALHTSKPPKVPPLALPIDGQPLTSIKSTVPSASVINPIKPISRRHSSAVSISIGSASAISDRDMKSYHGGSNSINLDNNLSKSVRRHSTLVSSKKSTTSTTTGNIEEKTASISLSLPLEQINNNENSTNATNTNTTTASTSKISGSNSNSSKSSSSSSSSESESDDFEDDDFEDDEFGDSFAAEGVSDVYTESVQSSFSADPAMAQTSTMSDYSRVLQKLVIDEGDLRKGMSIPPLTPMSQVRGRFNLARQFQVDKSVIQSMLHSLEDMVAEETDRGHSHDSLNISISKILELLVSAMIRSIWKLYMCEISTEEPDQYLNAHAEGAFELIPLTPLKQRMPSPKNNVIIYKGEQYIATPPGNLPNQRFPPYLRADILLHRLGPNVRQSQTLPAFLQMLPSMTFASEDNEDTVEEIEFLCRRAPHELTDLDFSSARG